MKIIHVVMGKANPERMNGVNKVAHNLALHQHRAGEDVEIWGISRSPAVPNPRRGYTLRVFQPFRARVLPPANLLRILASTDSSTVFHFHGGFVLEFAVLAACLRSAGLRYLVTPHGSLSPIALTRNAIVKRLYMRAVERRLLCGALGVQLFTGKEVTQVSSLIPGSRVFAIPNGQSLDELEHETVPVCRTSRPVFGFCGRLTTFTKGLDLLLQGFAQFARANANGVLWMVGGGPDGERLETMAKELGVHERVIFWGPLYGGQKLNLISHMDAFFHPSRHEGFPMSVLEAAGLSRYLVVSDGTNMGPFVRRHQAGVVLATNTAKEICVAMSGIELGMTNGQVARLGANARKMVETDLSWISIARRLRPYYCIYPGRSA